MKLGPPYSGAVVAVVGSLEIVVQAEGVSLNIARDVELPKGLQPRPYAGEESRGLLQLTREEATRLAEALLKAAKGLT